MNLFDSDTQKPKVYFINESVHIYLKVVVIVFLVAFGSWQEMNSGSGFVSPKHVSNHYGVFSLVKPPDDEADYVEKDPTNRYVRV